MIVVGPRAAFGEEIVDEFSPTHLSELVGEAKTHGDESDLRQRDG